MKKRFIIWDNPAQAIITLMVVLIALGAVNILSATFVDTQAPFSFFGKYVAIALGGFVAIWGIRKIGYVRLLAYKPLRHAAIIFMFGLLLWTDISGVNVKGAARWIGYGSFRFQPSEIAKVVVIFIAAYYLSEAQRLGRRVSIFKMETYTLKLLIPSLIFSAMVLKQPDMGTAAIIISLAFGMLIIGGLPLVEICSVFAVGGAGIAALAVAAPYRLERFNAWFNPWAYAQKEGYQTVQSLIAIGSGGWTGTRWGEGAGKFLYLPEAHTDFAFAIFCQENGFLGALLLIFIFTLLAVSFIYVIRNARDFQGFLLASGVTLLIIGQAFANMAMVCGMLPVIGVPLVFISYGGTSMLISMAAIGLLLSVYDAEVHPERLDAAPPDVRRSKLRVMRTGRRSER